MHEDNSKMRKHMSGTLCPMDLLTLVEIMYMIGECLGYFLNANATIYFVKRKGTKKKCWYQMHYMLFSWYRLILILPWTSVPCNSD